MHQRLDWPPDTESSSAKCIPADTFVPDSAGCFQSRFTRRRLLVGAGAALGSLVVAESALANSEIDSQLDVIAGTIESIVRPRTFIVTLNNAKPVVIEFAITCSCWRHARETELSSFLTGDEVVIEGRWRGSIFGAERLSTLYRGVQGTIIARHGYQLHTVDSIFVIVPETRPWNHQQLVAKPLSALIPGDDICALTWQDCSNNSLVAALVGVNAMAS